MMRFLCQFEVILHILKQYLHSIINVYKDELNVGLDEPGLGSLLGHSSGSFSM